MTKKKFYKDVWFWLFVVTLLLGSGFAHGSIKNANKVDNLTAKNKKLSKKAKSYDLLQNLYSASSNSSDEDSNDDNSDSSNSETFKLGESIEFKSGEKVTVNSISDSSVALQEASADEHAVAVNVTVENTGSSPLDFNAQEFDLYDSDNEISDFNAITYENNIPNSIAAGKKATIDIIYGAKKSGKYAVTYGDATWDN
ncbi:DUF4352 domain-containing protein [Latilactobacillus sakei]|uniref:DUF4352 domain-containing protein n=1 Tax=Latilactobacillus sakei TaxID=1599 RepID=UPI0020739BE5|nr:DUF4352 domain-containing protein [Latilactobacillus sakei]